MKQQMGLFFKRDLEEQARLTLVKGEIGEASSQP